MNFCVELKTLFPDSRVMFKPENLSVCGVFHNIFQIRVMGTLVSRNKRLILIKLEVRAENWQSKCTSLEVKEVLVQNNLIF